MTNTEQTTNAAGPTDPPTDPPTQPNVPQRASAEEKGKGRSADAMEEEADEDDEEDEGDDVDEGEDEDMEEDEEYHEIDAAAILPQGRRTRGIKIDYTSPEALKKAGLNNGEPVDGDEEDEVEGNTAS